MIIGNDCVIGRDVIEDSTIGDRTDILKSVIKESEVGADTRSDRLLISGRKAVWETGCKVGDFVEIKTLYSATAPKRRILHMSAMRTWAGMSMWAAAWFSLIMTEFTNSALKWGDRALSAAIQSRGAGAGGRRRVYRGGHYGYRRCAGRARSA